MTAAGVVDDDIEVAGLAKCAQEHSINLATVPQIKLNWMKMFLLGEAHGIAGRSPDLVTAPHQHARRSQTDSGTRSGEKNMFHQAKLFERL